jgi:catalase
MELSPTLSLIKKAVPTLTGRKVAVLVTDGTDDALLAALKKAVEKEGAALAIIAPKIGGVTTAKGVRLAADQALSGAPSVLFDAVAALPSEAGAALLAQEAGAIDWLRDAFGHLKVIGFTDAAAMMFAKAGIARDADEGVVDLNGGVAAFITAAKQHRIWAREPTLRSPG